jgi:methionyl-tRNA formyltransferase
MTQAMDKLEHHQLTLTRQSSIEETYATKIDKTETRIDWGRPARKVLRHIHGLSPSPGAWCEMPISNQPTRVVI